MASRMARVLSLTFAIGALLVTLATPAFGQFGDLADKLKKKTPKLLGGKAPITTSLPDAKWEDASKDGFTPRRWVKAVAGYRQAAGLCTLMVITFAIFRQVTVPRELRFGCRTEARRWVRNMIRQRTSLCLETPQDNDSSSQVAPSNRIDALVHGVNSEFKVRAVESI